MLKENFRLQHKEMILSLQYCRVNSKDNECTWERMVTLCIMAGECSYKGYDRRLKEQFINGIDNEDMIKEIIKELTD